MIPLRLFRFHGRPSKRLIPPDSRYSIAKDNIDGFVVVVIIVDVAIFENGVTVRVAVVRPDPPDVISNSHDVSYRYCNCFEWIVVVGGAVDVDVLAVGVSGIIHIRRCCIHRIVGVIRILDMEANGIGIIVLARIDAS